MSFSMSRTLVEVVERYELSNEISARYAYQLRYAVHRFAKFKADPTVDDLSTDQINRWLVMERDSAQLSARSRANVRRSMLTLWSTCRQDLRRDSIRSVTVTPKNPEAWHYDEMSRVAEAAGQLPGVLTNGINRSLYMTTLLWFAYESGLRRGDLWAFDIERFDTNRIAAMTQHKTQRVHLVAATDETLSAMRRIATTLRESNNASWKTPLLWPQSESTFYDLMRRCRRAAGVDANVRNRSLQHIRRTGATQVDSDGGAAWRFLGHSREGLDRMSYVDARKTVEATMPQLNRANHERN